MRTLLNHALKRVYLDNFARGLFRDFRATKRDIRWHYIRKFGRIDKEIIDNYLIKHQIRKLHIGCGKNILKDDWLNSDYRPWWHSILHLDATEAFPIPSETFDYIFSEHMIEHIPYSVGLEMLIECHRILKNNGKIRISTPDLKFLIDLYINDRLKLQSEYIKWSTDNFIENAPYYDGIFVLNNFVRDWGHLFIYDEKTLRSSLEKAGFTSIVRYNLNVSSDDTFKNLENEKRMPDGFLKLESFTLEATKILHGQ